MKTKTSSTSRKEQHSENSEARRSSTNMPTTNQTRSSEKLKNDGWRSDGESIRTPATARRRRTETTTDTTKTTRAAEKPRRSSRKEEKSEKHHPINQNKTKPKALTRIKKQEKAQRNNPPGKEQSDEEQTHHGPEEAKNQDARNRKEQRHNHLTTEDTTQGPTYHEQATLVRLIEQTMGEEATQDQAAQPEHLTTRKRTRTALLLLPKEGDRGASKRHIGDTERNGEKSANQDPTPDRKWMKTQNGEARKGIIQNGETSGYYNIINKQRNGNSDLNTFARDIRRKTHYRRN